jgi:hypothetical protein
MREQRSGNAYGVAGYVAVGSEFLGLCQAGGVVVKLEVACYGMILRSTTLWADRQLPSE